jgi:hypothetical protein
MVFLLVKTLTPQGFILHQDVIEAEKDRTDVILYGNKELQLFGNALFPILVSLWIIFSE